MTTKRIRVNNLKTNAFWEDLIWEILIRVPTKTLCRCKCVSKTWLNLILEQSVVHTLSVQPKSALPSTGFFYSNLKGKLNFHSFDNETDVNGVNASLSFLNGRSPSIYVAASHNGLLLGAEKRRTRWYSEPYLIPYFVCNPFHKRCLALPEPLHKHYVKLTLLFCYDREEQVEFKVVAFAGYRCNVIEMYSSETGQWKASTFSHTYGYYGYGPFDNTTWLDGFVYLWNNAWIGDVYMFTIGRKIL